MYEPDYNTVQDEEARKWAMFCHLGGLCVLSSVPFAGIIVPLILWLLKRESHPFIDEQGREAINFQICMVIYFFVSFVVLIILTILTIGIFLWWLLGVFVLVQCGLSVAAAIKANNGERFRYPITIRFL